MSDGTVRRYEVVERFACNGQHSHWALVDTYTGRELGCDGGEPEDQLLVRDWEWVGKEMNDLHDALRTQARELAMALVQNRIEICPFMYGSPQELAWLQNDKEYQLAQAVLKEGA